MFLTLQTRLLALKNSLLRAMGAGHDSLIVLYKEWTLLQTDIQNALTLNLVEPEDLITMEKIVSTVQVLVSMLAETESESERLLNSMLEDMALSPPCDVDVILAEWFLSHIDNPYPTRAQKDQLSQQSGVAVKRVESWMTAARKSTGWTTLCQEMFSGSHTAVSKAAYELYFGDLSSSKISPEMTYALLVVKSKAEKLLAEAEQRVMRQGGCEPIALHSRTRSSPQLPQENAGIKYPGGIWVAFPDGIHFSPYDYCFTSDDDEEDMSPPAPVAGVKRRCLDEPVPSKRPRIEQSCSSPVAQAADDPLIPRHVSMPIHGSCASMSRNGSMRSLSENLDVLVPTSNVSTTSCKRRIRDAVDDDQQPQTKRHCGMGHLSRIDVTSDDAFSPGLTSLGIYDRRPDNCMSPLDIPTWQSSLAPSPDQTGPSSIAGHLSSSIVSSASDRDVCDMLIPFSTDAVVSHGSSKSLVHNKLVPFDCLDPLGSLPAFTPPSNNFLSIQSSELNTDRGWYSPIDHSSLWDFLGTTLYSRDAVSEYGPDTQPELLSASSESDSSSEASTPKSQFDKLYPSSNDQFIDLMADFDHYFASLVQ